MCDDARIIMASALRCYNRCDDDDHCTFLACALRC